jgi:DNA-binding SARP family transcriptional activator
LATEVRFGLLGPLLVRRGGLVVPIPSAKQRVMLAALLLGANRVVSLDELCAQLWGDVRPASALMTLRNYVKRARYALGDTDHSQILTRPSGYLYHVADTLTGLGDTHHVAGDPSSARLAWQQALAMFDELRHPKAEQLRARLDGLPSDIMQLPAGTPG